MTTKKDTKPNWSSFSKAELIRTIKALDRRQTKLLNELAALKTTPDVQAAVNAAYVTAIGDDCGVVHVKSSFPWQEPGDTDNEPDTDGLSDAQ